MIYFVESHLGSFYLTDKEIPKVVNFEENEDYDKVLFSYHEDDEEEKYNGYLDFLTADFLTAEDFNALGSSYVISLNMLNCIYSMNYLNADIYSRLRNDLDLSYLKNLRYISDGVRRKRKPKLYS